MPAHQIQPTNPFIEFKKRDTERSLFWRFQRMVERYPKRLAIKDRGEEVSYETLGQIADRVAGAIAARAGDRQTPIALLFDQGVGSIAAVFGAWKAGRLFVSVDPSVSPDRNQHILKDSRAALVLTENRHLQLAKSFQGTEILNIDETAAGLSAAVDVSIEPELPACILYTSGSTGKPKGVVHSHRNLLHVTRNYTNRFHASYRDRFILLYSPSVIGALRVILLALLNGGSLFPFRVREEGFTDMAGHLHHEEITVLFAITSLFREFAGALEEEERFPKLRLIRLGGETVTNRDVDLYKKKFSDDCLLVNRLGSTECTTFCCYFMNKESPPGRYGVPVGYPLEGWEVFLIDPERVDGGPDEIGEIAVKSRYLFDGYWGQPDLTRASLQSDPQDKGKRIFRTGDLGRKLGDGCLIHLGRKDRQVKVRGCRVDLSEVESALLDLESIDKAVVDFRGISGEQQLVGYLVASDKPPTVTDLRKRLSRRLPDYMIPTAWVVIEKIPRTRSGKVDRQGLPEPARQRPLLDSAYVAPQSSTEVEVAKIWSEVLGLPRVGTHDSFFELGGDSLRAGRVISGVRRKLKVKLPVRTLFEAPTVAAMSAVVAEHLDAENPQERDKSRVSLLGWQTVKKNHQED